LFKVQTPSPPSPFDKLRVTVRLGIVEPFDKLRVTGRLGILEPFDKLRVRVE
jgi:hypothetical protein